MARRTERLLSRTSLYQVLFPGSVNPVSLSSIRNLVFRILTSHKAISLETEGITLPSQERYPNNNASNYRVPDRVRLGGRTSTWLEAIAVSHHASSKARLLDFHKMGGV